MKSFPSNYSDEVEANGVTFKTEVQSVIPTPKLPFGQIPFKLGIHVTNNTDTCLNFERLSSIHWLNILTDSYSNPVEVRTGFMRLRVRGEPDYYQIFPEESYFFPLTAILYRRICKLHLKIDIDAGDFVYFDNLKTASYQLQLNYKNSGCIRRFISGKLTNLTGWSGSVTIPSVEFRIGY